MMDALENKQTLHGSASTSVPEVVIGVLHGSDNMGAPLVDWAGNQAGAPVAALSTATFTPSDVGSAAALLFANGDPTRPVIVGLVRQPLDHVLSATSGDASSAEPIQTMEMSDTVEADAGKPSLEARVDGARVVISGDEEIVLRCGKASITLTRSGKVLIRGEYLSSRSTGTNRIKGGSVQMN